MTQTEPKNILLVDDEEAIRFFVGSGLVQKGWQVQEADSGEAALALLAQQTFAVILLDLRMAGLDGLDVLREVAQSAPETRVIILTAYASVDSAISAIQHKVFDYLRKPCDTQQVVAAVERAWAEKQEFMVQQDLGQPSGETAVFHPPIRTADLQIDLSAHTVTKNQHPIALTPTEYEILACLAKNIGSPVSVNYLVATVLDFDPTDYQAQETLRVHISRLRKKIGDNYIHTLRGGKYTLAYSPPQSPS